jgi:hypothetical protein
LSEARWANFLGRRFKGRPVRSNRGAPASFAIVMRFAAKICPKIALT